MPQTASELFTDRPVVMRNIPDVLFVPHKVKDTCDGDDLSQNSCWIKKIFASEISKCGWKKIVILFMGPDNPILCSSMKLALWASRKVTDFDRYFAGLCIVKGFIRVQVLVTVIQTSTYKKSKTNYSSLTVNFVKKNVILKLENTMTMYSCTTRLSSLDV